jgi:hypothetical protein
LGHSGHSRVQLQVPLAWLDLRVRAEELLQEEALGPGVMASGVRVATITRFFSVDKRFEEEKAADRKSALAKWLDWLARRRLRQLLKQKGLHPKGLLADQRKLGKLRQFL